MFGRYAGDVEDLVEVLAEPESCSQFPSFYKEKRVFGRSLVCISGANTFVNRFEWTEEGVKTKDVNHSRGSWSIFLLRRVKIRVCEERKTISEIQGWMEGLNVDEVGAF